jgi:hypothetical protein
MFELIMMHILLTIPVGQACITNATAWYTYPNLTALNLTNGFQYFNCATNNIFWTFISFILFGIMVYAGKGYNIVAVAMVAAFSMSLITSVSTILQWTDVFVPVLYFIIAAVAASWFWFMSG